MSSVTSTNQCWVDGKYLVVRSGAILPRLCIKTNESVSDSEYSERSIKWTKEVRGRGSALVAIISYFRNRQYCKLTYGLSSAQSSKLLIFFVAKLLLMLFGLIGMFMGAAMNWDPIVLLVLFAICFVFMILLPFGNKPLAIIREQDGLFWLKGCSAEFLERVQQGCSAEA